MGTFDDYSGAYSVLYNAVYDGADYIANYTVDSGVPTVYGAGIEFDTQPVTVETYTLYVRVA